MDFLELAKLRQSCRSYDENRDVEPEKLADFPDIVDSFSEDPDIKGIAHVYDMSKVFCELCNDLQNKRLVLYHR